MSRRTFLGTASTGALIVGPGPESQSRSGGATGRKKDAATPGPIHYAVQNCVTEFAYSSGKPYADPFNDVQLDVEFQDPEGRKQRVPAFWAGDQVWRVRYSASRPGRYTYHSISSDASNPDIHDQRGILEVAPYKGDNPVARHGGIQIAADRRHFEHADGTPFFWLADTWSMGLCKRLNWPDEFQMLVQDRKNKGFTVVLIIAGLYPDMTFFDPRGANEAGYPWEADYARINPHYFDMADLRIRHLVEQGIVPCIFGCWGFFLPEMGIPRTKKHWRELIARWGAYPVIWCLAGEASTPYYLSKNKREEAALEKTGWTELARYVRSTDPYRRPITIHPNGSAMNMIENPALLDFDMLATSHNPKTSVPATVNLLAAELLREPRMPVLVGEVCFEGIMDDNHEQIQRYLFWACILSGAAGHSYGANGVWQVNTPSQPFGAGPTKRCWGNTPWQEACRFPGSEELGLAKKMLMRYPWWRFEVHPEWVEPHWSKANHMLPFAAGVPGEVRVVFIPPAWEAPVLKSLESAVTYRAFFFDPRSGEEHLIGQVTADATGSWQPPLLPTFEQWVLVVERA